MPKKIAAEDDYERNIRSPEMCVDYLSYHFDEMDLAASWRVMTKQKKDIVNGLRLENASWRTWAKQKNKLKTVSPETLNWLKDSDVTWLYGPLHTVIHDQEDRYSKPKISSTQDTLGLITAPPPLTEQQIKPPVLRKPEPLKVNEPQKSVQSQPSTPTGRPLKSALKRVTMSDILKRSASEIHVDTLNSLGPDPSLSIAEANKQLGVFSPSVIATHRQPKLRFNQHVEQCIALSSDEKTARSRSNSQATDSSRLENTEDPSGDEHIVRPPRSSIKKIAPARLKNSSQSENETDVSSLSSSASSTGQCGMFANIQTANSSRRNSYSSWDDNDDDEAIPAILNPAHPIRVQPPEDQAIRWEGQPCVYDVVPSSDVFEEEEEEEEEDDDDWDTNDEEDDRILHEVAGPSRNSTVQRTSLPGPQISPKSPPLSEPSHYQTVADPQPNSPSSYRAVADIHRLDQEQRTTSPSLISQVANWASSLIWSSPR
ncbi:hypothetical protein CLU79DRAFT_883008 [Phycomyces nitens]|nr:hypothetical protein CLU79DRAFT_883008 [Phycomyces nitens]